MSAPITIRNLSILLLSVSVFVFALSVASGQITVAQDKPPETAPASQPAAEDKPEEKPADAKPDAKKDDAKDDAKDEAKKESPKEPPKKQVRVLALSGSYEDLPTSGGLNPTELLLGGGLGKPKAFYRLCDYLDELSHEEIVSHVVFDLSAAGLSMNPAQLDELTRRVQHMRSHGKKCIAWLESASNVQLAIAAACDEVLLADLGEIDMPSSSMETMFYRDAMDLLGIQASVTRAGDFKGAVEPYLNATMSKHLKEHYLAMLESINNAQVTRIAKGRGLSVGTVRELQRKRMLVPSEALASRLVDRLVPYGSMKKTIMDGLGENYEWTTPKSKPKREVSIFELLGKAMAGPKDPSKLKDNSIVVLHLSGTIEDGKTNKPGSIVSGPTVKLIEQLTADDKVKGVVVRINSPGGSATASEAIRQALDSLAKKKTLVYSMGEMAASGGYWITCIGQPVFAEHGTITGSIGVFSLKVSAGTLMRRIGVHVESVTLDPAAGMQAIHRAWSEEDVEKMQGFIDLIYDKFLQIASTSRNIPVDTLKSLAGGRVWSGEQAKANRLVDQLGGLDDALAMVAKGAKLDNYKVVHRPEASSGLDLGQLLSGQEDEIDIAISEVWDDQASELPRGRWVAILETRLLAMLREQGFRGDSTCLLFRSIDWAGNQPAKAWALLGEELKISH